MKYAELKKKYPRVNGKLVRVLTNLFNTRETSVVKTLLIPAFNIAVKNLEGSIEKQQNMVEVELTNLDLLKVAQLQKARTLHDITSTLATLGPQWSPVVTGLVVNELQSSIYVYVLEEYLREEAKNYLAFDSKENLQAWAEIVKTFA